MSRDQTIKYKKLQAFATREYKEKKPKRVVVRRISSFKIVPKTLIPRINVKSDIDLNPFLLISDFGSNLRLYYLLPDCTMLGAENYDKKEFEKIEKKIKKYSKKVIELPQITAEEMFDEKRTPYHKILSQMKNLRFDFKELESKFVREFKNLSNLTGLTGKLKNITLTDKESNDRRFGVIIDKNKIQININFLNSPLIEGIIYRECLLALIPKYISCDVIDLCSFGAYILLPDEYKNIWLEKWKETSKTDEIKLKIISKNDLKKIFSFFGYIKPYLDKSELTERESNQLLHIILDNLKESNRSISLKYFRYLIGNLKNQNELFDILKAKEILLNYMVNKEKVDIKHKNDFVLINLSLNLIKMQYNEFYTKYNEIQNIPVGLNRIFLEYLRENSPLKLKLIYPNQAKTSEIIDLIIMVKNVSNLSFSNITVKESLDSAFEKIANKQDEEKIKYLNPFKTIKFIFRLKAFKTGRLKLKAIGLSCESNLNQLYKLKSKPIKIEII